MDGNQVNQTEIKENEKKGRGLFYGVVAVATFIIMAVGATYAYFTATAQGASSSVHTGSTTLNLKFISYNDGWMNSDLIPADDYIVVHSFLNQNDTTITNTDKLSNALCKDDNGSTICSVYVFQVYNSNSSGQSLSISLSSENNGFANLWVMGYGLALPTDSEALNTYNGTENNNHLNDPKFLTGNEEEGVDTTSLIQVTDANGNLRQSASFETTKWAEREYFPVYPNRSGVVKTLWKVTNTEKTSRVSSNVKVAVSGERVLVADQYEIAGNSVGTFALVLYIKDTGSDQTADDGGENGKEFYGTVIVSTDDNPDAAVTGRINAVVKNDMEDLLNDSEAIDSGSGSTEPGTEPSDPGTEPTP